MEEKQRKWTAPLALLLAVFLIVTSFFWGTHTGLFKQNGFQNPKNGQVSQWVWHLDSLYKTDEDWQRDFVRFKKLLGDFEGYKGHMGDDAKHLLAVLQAKDDLDKLYDRLYAYALLRRDGNFSDEAAKTMWTSISSYVTEKGERTAFFYSELYKMPKYKLKRYAAEAILAEKRQKLMEIAEDDYEPDERADYIKAISGNLLGMPEKFYQAYTYEYQDQNQDVTGDASRGSRTDADPQVRKKAFDASNQKLERGMPLLSVAMAAKVEANRFKAKSEGYQDVVESFINDDGIGLETYNVLMQEAEKDSDLLKRYISYKRKALKLKEPVQYYDADLRTTKDYGVVSFEQAVDLNRQVVKQFGPHYADVFEKALKEKWMDVYPRDNKYSGSYTYGAYTGHPYVLLNFEDNLESAATLAHESGHAVHQYLNNKARTYEDSEIPMINAEIASTVNEILFYDQLLKSAKSKDEKATVLEAALDNYNGGFFYQAALAKFQDRIHHDAEAGIPLETSYFNKTFGQMLASAYGPDYKVQAYDEEGWAQVDHLYWDFYVYKYVMCMAVAVDLAERLETGDEQLLKAYTQFLESGSTRSVEDNMKSLGIDLSKSEYLKPFRARYDENLNELIHLNNQ